MSTFACENRFARGRTDGWEQDEAGCSTGGASANCLRENLKSIAGGAGPVPAPRPNARLGAIKRGKRSNGGR